MTNIEPIIGECEREACGRAYDFERVILAPLIERLGVVKARRALQTLAK